MSLTNLADRLSELGRREEALAAAQEAAGLYRTLAGARPEAFRRDLALSLNNLAAVLSELGGREGLGDDRSGDPCQQRTGFRAVSGCRNVST
jgi:hypothetical protein